MAEVRDLVGRAMEGGVVVTAAKMAAVATAAALAVGWGETEEERQRGARVAPQSPSAVLAPARCQHWRCR